jgi:uncharacterized protein YqhQ
VSKKLDVGGQAVLEGVMMRGPHSMVIAVRRADGSILVKDSEWVPLVQRLKFLKWPLLRGATMMVESLVNGMQALSFSADVAMQDEENAKRLEEAEAAGVVDLDAARTDSDDANAVGSAMTKGAIALSLTISLLMGIGLFIYLPHGAAAAVFNLIGGAPITQEAPVELPLFHLLVGAIKMSIFIAYIALIRRMSDIRRVFQYHGAEHKSIHVYEAGEELTVENARKWPTFHPRCGTSFLVFVILISIGVFAAAFPLIEPFLPAVEGWKLNLMQASIKIPLMIPIAGLSYEFIKWAGRRKGSRFLGFMSIPGRLVQKLTTIEPDDDQLEVALTSLKRALEHEGTLLNPNYTNVTFLPAAS